MNKELKSIINEIYSNVFNESKVDNVVLNGIRKIINKNRKSETKSKENKKKLVEVDFTKFKEILDELYQKSLEGINQEFINLINTLIDNNFSDDKSSELNEKSNKNKSDKKLNKNQLNKIKDFFKAIKKNINNSNYKENNIEKANKVLEKIDDSIEKIDDSIKKINSSNNEFLKKEKKIY